MDQQDKDNFMQRLNELLHEAKMTNNLLFKMSGTLDEIKSKLRLF